MSTRASSAFVRGLVRELRARSSSASASASASSSSSSSFVSMTHRAYANAVRHNISPMVTRRVTTMGAPKTSSAVGVVAREARLFWSDAARAMPRGGTIWEYIQKRSGASPLRAKRMYSTSSSGAVLAPSTLVVGGERATRRVAWWLAGGCAWVFSMVVLGGATRLTRSGLSMTDWKFQYEHPPLTDEDWAREFEKYKQSPEFKKTNLGMTVDEYKFIYWMEYGHRMWGRVLGLYFVGPLAYFASQGYITSALAKRLGVFFILGATQGMIGWWMVKSGLEEQEFSYDCPRVSPYRLATHLTGAFTIYTGMLWTTLSVISPLSPSQSPDATKMLIDASKRLRGVVHPLAGLIGVTAISGAYVAGMDAGRAYNTFPLMGGKVVPDEYWAQWEQKGWRNFFENTAAVQFDHRVLALTTLTAVSAVWLGHRGSHALHPQSRMLLHALLATTAGQVTLGVATLLYHVPVELGSAHQANALALFSVVLALMHSLRGPKRVPRI